MSDQTVTLFLQDLDHLAFLGNSVKAFRYVTDSIAAEVSRVDPQEIRYHIETDKVGNKVLWRMQGWLEYLRYREAHQDTDPVLTKMLLKFHDPSDLADKLKLLEMINEYKRTTI